MLMNQEEENALAAAVGSHQLQRVQSRLESLPEAVQAEARAFALKAASSIGWEEALPALFRDDCPQETLAECLYAAAEIGHLSLVRRLLALGAPANGAPLLRDTPLTAAVEGGYTEVVRELLAAGADPNLVLRGGDTAPLSNVRSWESDVEIVRLLLRAGAEVNSKDFWRSPLHYAVEGFGGDEEPLETVSLLLDAGANPNCVEPYQLDTPLHVAAMCGQERVLSLLLEHGAEVDAENRLDCTPLWSALWYQQPAAARLLVAAGAKTDWIAGQDGADLLAHADWAGDQVTKRLLETLGATPEPEEEKGEEATAPVQDAVESPLVQAVRYGDAAAVASLLEAGAEVNGSPGDRRSPLVEALAGACVEVARLLLEAGAEVSWNERREENPLTLGAELGDVELMRQLLERCPEMLVWDGVYTPLMAAARGGHTALVALLLEREDAGVECLYLLDSALMLAAGAGHLAVVRQLLDAGARVDSDVFRGVTALCSAAAAGQVAVLRLLLERGAAVNAGLVNYSSTPLMLAAQGGHAEALRCLLEAGARVDVPGHYQGGPLARAAAGGHLECMQLLLDAGAEVELRIAQGDTPLCLAAAAGQAEAVKLLLAAGAGVDTRGEDGMTPFLFAAARGNAETVHALLKAGADASAWNDFGRNALQLALREGREATAAFLRACCADELAEEGWIEKEIEHPSPLYLAAERGDAEALRLLLDEAESAKEPWEKHLPQALDEAAVANSTECVRLLLERARRRYYEPLHLHYPLEKALLHGNCPMLELLVSYGADINVPLFHSDGCALAVAASALGSAEMVRILLAHGAETEEKESHELTALVLAAERGDEESVRLLVEAGADLYAHSEWSSTAMAHAARQGNEGLVRFLIEHGWCGSKEPDLCLHEAAVRGSIPIAEMLLDAGMPLYARDGDKKTAYDAALSCGHTDMAQYLRRRAESSAATNG